MLTLFAFLVISVLFIFLFWGTVGAVAVVQFLDLGTELLQIWRTRGDCYSDSSPTAWVDGWWLEWYFRHCCVPACEDGVDNVQLATIVASSSSVSNWKPRIYPHPSPIPRFVKFRAS
eukprot:627024-Amphidinium_carterae.1